MKKISVAIIEDTEAVRMLLQKSIRKSNKFTCDQIYETAEDALLFLPKSPVDIVLMDIHLPGMNGIACVAKLRGQLPQAQFIMCTTSDEDEHIFEALKAGATGYLLKNLKPDELVNSLLELHDGGSPMSAAIARKVVNAFAHSAKVKAEMPDELSEREKELLQLLADGLMYKEIAAQLFISMDTVKKHCQNIYKKLEVKSRSEAINKVFMK